MADLDETSRASAAEPADAILRTRFHERYRVDVFLGRGNFGTVFRAHDEWIDDDVALKILNFVPSPEQLRQFRDEVRLARRVTHRHVARLHDVGADRDSHYITMQLVEGRDLRALLRDEGQSDRPGLLAVAACIAEGLAAAHEAGVVHRDLKPANVMVSEAGGVWITDFGLACATTDAVDVRGGGGGTPAYMAPEQLAGEPVTTAADVYAFGLVLWELLTGEVPMLADNFWATVRARIDDPLPDPLASWSAMPIELVRLLQRCLARAPDERPHADEIVAILAASGQLLQPADVGQPTLDLGHSRSVNVRRAASQAPAQSGPALLGVDATARVYPLDATTTTIGRAADSDIVLDDASVSSHHARIVRSRGSLMLVNLGATNGTRINGSRVASASLEPGDVIELGSVMLRFALTSAPQAPAGASEGDDHALLAAVVEACDRDGGVTVVELAAALALDAAKVEQRLRSWIDRRGLRAHDADGVLRVSHPAGWLRDRLDGNP